MDSQPSQKKILIIEDDQDVGRIVCLVLEKEGYDAKLVSEAGEGLEFLSAQSVDLVICDVMLPEVDGLQLVQQIKQNPKTADIPVMMMSALTENEDIRRGQSAGAEYYLSKPFERTQLLAAVKGVFATAMIKSRLTSKS